MYSQDSFFDLSLLSRLSVIGIGIVLFVLAVLAAWALLRTRGSVLRIGGALVLFWLFVWLSPQVYYMFYWLTFPDLPLQWVIWPPPGPAKPLSMLLFQYRQNLSAHGQGILGWCMIAAPFAAGFWGRPKRAKG